MRGDTIAAGILASAAVCAVVGVALDIATPGATPPCRVADQILVDRAQVPPSLQSPEWIMSAIESVPEAERVEVEIISQNRGQTLTHEQKRDWAVVYASYNHDMIAATKRDWLKEFATYGSALELYKQANRHLWEEKGEAPYYHVAHGIRLVGNFTQDGYAYEIEFPEEHWPQLWSMKSRLAWLDGRELLLENQIRQGGPR